MIYLYDGTYEGFLCAVFDAFKRHETPDDILAEQPEQIGFFQSFHSVITDAAHARRVEQGIVRSMSVDMLSYVFAAMHSAQVGAGRDLLVFLQLGFKVGSRIMEHLTEDCVVRVMRMARHVWFESGRWREFLRFHELKNGVYIAQYEPEHDVTELMMPYFADRFADQPFIIHDRGRRKAGVYHNGTWMIASSEQMVLPPESEREARYQKMWLCFYDTVAIRARENPGLRRQLMPKKFWKDMLEVNRSASS